MPFTESQINERHRNRWAEARDKYGSAFKVPRDVVAALSEATRQDWVEFVADRDGTAKVVEAHKMVHAAAKLAEFCDQVPGLEVDATLLAAAVGCSESTARNFINDSRSRFTAVPGKRGRYVVVDVAAARAADKSGAIPPASVPVVAPAASAGTGAVSAPDMAEIEAGLAQIGGHHA